MIPCILFEDEHLLVVDKPSGVNTHAPSPFAGEGLYDWLRHREARWGTLAIIHRLDKETSGVMVFGKTPLANRSLTEQFTAREVHKKYLLLTDRPVTQQDCTVKSSLARAGEKYASQAIGEPAETHFHVLESRNGRTLLEATPRTGRTHQIRVHAAESGFPILGDTLYGGTASERVFLHAAELSFKHPATGATCEFKSATVVGQATHLFGGGHECEPGRPTAGTSHWPGETPVPLPSGSSVGSMARRLELIDPTETNAFRVIHGASDAWPGWYVERLGDFLLSQSEHPLTDGQQIELDDLRQRMGARGAYHKTLNRQVRRTLSTDASPQLVLGEAAPEHFTIMENGVHFELSFTEGYSVGIFLDQRDNRRRFLSGHVAAGFPLTRPSATLPMNRSAPVPGHCNVTNEATRQIPEDHRSPTPQRPGTGALHPGSEGQIVNLGGPTFEVLNTFAYTCGFSVCAAKAGGRVTSLDLSKKYLEWGTRNFTLNGLDPAQHDFIFGDAFDWLRRLAKKGRAFDAVVLDPPTFSQSKESGVFRAEKDYGKLVVAALGVLQPGGVLLASTNAAEWLPEDFVETVKAAVASAKRRIAQQHFVPQPLDFPITRAEPGYLKTLWIRVD